jgi:RimJ/RimL family protein N-acetyltransferase
MIYELNKEDYEKVRPLCRGLDYHLTMQAVIDGESPGRIYVDDVQTPHTAFICSVEGYYLAGDSENADFSQALSDLIHGTGESGKTFRDGEDAIELDVFPQAWERHMSTLFPDYAPLIEQRRKYLCTQLRVDWKKLLPDGYSVHPIDQYLLDHSGVKISDHVHGWIRGNWGSREYFFQHGFGFCLVHEQQVVSWSVADCISGDRSEIGIQTLPKYQRRGLATITVAATVDFCFSQGFKSVGWHCNDNNIGSWKTAEKVGFVKERDYQFYLYFFDKAVHLAETGWRCVQVKRYREAVDAFQQVFTLKEDAPHYWHHSAAMAYAGTGDSQTALSYLKNALERGWPHLDFTQSREEFTSLHGTPEWENMMMQNH